MYQSNCCNRCCYYSAVARWRHWYLQILAGSVLEVSGGEWQGGGVSGGGAVWRPLFQGHGVQCGGYEASGDCTSPRTNHEMLLGVSTGDAAEVRVRVRG